MIWQTAQQKFGDLINEQQQQNWRYKLENKLSSWHRHNNSCRDVKQVFLVFRLCVSVSIVLSFHVATAVCYLSNACAQYICIGFYRPKLESVASRCVVFTCCLQRLCLISSKVNQCARLLRLVERGTTNRADITFIGALTVTWADRCQYIDPIGFVFLHL